MIDRNLRGHAEAVAARYRWSHEYAHEQRCGQIDFWDGLSAERKRLIYEMVDAILQAAKEHGRAPALTRKGMRGWQQTQ